LSNLGVLEKTFYMQQHHLSPGSTRQVNSPTAVGRRGLLNARCAIASDDVCLGVTRRRANFPNDRHKIISSADRLDCEHFLECSGCSLDSDIASPPSIDIARAYFRLLGHTQNLEFHVGSVHGWRNRARLAVRRDPYGKGVAIGLFREKTHDIVKIPNCKAHHPAINEATQLLQDCIASSSILPYDETTGNGQLRYVQFTVVETVNVPDQVQVECLLVWNAHYATEQTDPVLIEFSMRLYRSAPSLFSSVYVNYQPDMGNNILGQHTRHLCGAMESWVRVGDLPLALHPGSFVQVNPAAMGEVMKDIRSWTPRSCRLVDLHAGVGTIALSLAATHDLSSLTLVEINETAKSMFWKSWTGLSDRMKFDFKPEYHVAAAESDPGAWCQQADMVVVDPPRKGLDSKLLEFLCQLGPKEGADPKTRTSNPVRVSVSRLAYLSCGWKAFTRDCSALLSSGTWKLVYAKAYLFFPGTDHLEILAIFDRL
jgi:tRNA/tmRNA/rRNA uracil-C5-methylase (TrmA/RlmC/RlmD family)